MLAGNFLEGARDMEGRIAAGAAWTVASNWIEQAVAFAVYVAIARFIGADAFGVAAMALAFVMLGEVLLRDTLAEGLISNDDSDDRAVRKHEESAFWALVLFADAIIAILVAGAPVIARLFDDARVAPIMQTLAPTCLFVAISGVPTAKLRRDMAFRTLAIRAIAGVIGGGLVGVVMAANGMGAWSLVGQRLTLVSVNALLAMTGARWFPRSAPWTADFSLLRGLGPKVVMLRSLTIIITQTPVIALGVAAGSSAVAMYSFAARLVEITLFLIVAPIKRVVQPAAAAMKRLGGDTRRFFADMTELTALAAFAAFAGLAFIGEEFVGLLMGDEWRLAGAIIAPLCAAGALTALTEIQEGYLLALDKPSRFLRATFAEALIGVALVALASAYGPIAVGAAVALRAAAMAPIRTAATLSAENIGATRYLSALTGPLLAMGAMAGVLALWRAFAEDRLSALAYLPATILIGAASFLAAAALITPSTVRRMRIYAGGTARGAATERSVADS